MNILKQETSVAITNGTGVIQVKGLKYFSCILASHPQTLAWYNMRGSVGMYLEIAQVSTAEQERIGTKIQAVVADTLREDVPLSKSLQELLDLFPNGLYTLTHYTPDVPFAVFKNSADFYPHYDDIYYFTRPEHTVDQDRVAHFVEKIQAGSNPVVITCSAQYKNVVTNDKGEKIDTGSQTWGEFVIDGHHKLLAYEQLQQAPDVVNIRLDAQSEAELTTKPEIYTELLSAEQYQHFVSTAQR